jgi:hypothetical protein
MGPWFEPKASGLVLSSYDKLLGHDLEPQSFRTQMPKRSSAPGLPELNLSQMFAYSKSPSAWFKDLQVREWANRDLSIYCLPSCQDEPRTSLRMRSVRRRSRSTHRKDPSRLPTPTKSKTISGLYDEVNNKSGITHGLVHATQRGPHLQVLRRISWEYSHYACHIQRYFWGFDCTTQSKIDKRSEIILNTITIL